MRICKIFTWDASHQLALPYDSKCTNLHGHTYKVEIEVQGDPDEHGIVMDFAELKRRVEAISFDHQHLNDWTKLNPTAEHIVYFLKLRLAGQWKPGDPLIRRIRVWETPTSWAEEVWDIKMEALDQELRDAAKNLKIVNKRFADYLDKLKSGKKITVKR